MIETIIKCDVCNKPGAESYKYADGCSMDASGNGYNTDWVYKDWCFECMAGFIKNNPDKKLKKDPARYTNYSFLD